MLPLRLELKNFLAYRSPEPVCFEGIHLACITGINGAGKSSLLDAITWVLWGQARAKRDDELINQGQADMYVQLDFEQERTVYRVIRQRSRKGRGATSLDLFVVDNGELRTLSESTARQTQLKINDLLRLDYETFVHSAFLQQGKADAFTTKAPAQRKQLLSDILGLDRWAAYEENAKRELATVEQALGLIEHTLNGIEEELRREPELRDALRQAEEEQERAKHELEAAEALLAEVESALADLRNAQQQRAALEGRCRQHELDREKADRDIKAQQDRIAEAERTLEQRPEIEDGYRMLQAARAADHSLGDKLMQYQAFSERIGRVETAIEAVRSALASEVRECDSAIQELRRTIDSARPDELTDLLDEIAGLEGLEEERERYATETTELEKERSGREADKKRLYETMHEVRTRMNNIQAVTAPDCPLCGQPLTESHKNDLLQALEADGKALKAEFVASGERIEAITRQLAERKRGYDDLGKQLRHLAGLRQSAASLSDRLGAADEAQRRLDEHQARRDTAQATLDAEAFALEERATLVALRDEQAALGYDSGQHTAARKQLTEYAAYEDRYRKLEMAEARLPDMRAALDGGLARRDGIVALLDEDTRALAACDQDIARLEEQKRVFLTREQVVKSFRLAEREAGERVVVAKQDLRALDKLRERRDTLHAEREEKRDRKALYEELKLAFGKNGIPAMIIDNAIPELEASANRILGRMTDGRMTLYLNTQREKVTGGTAETLEIQINEGPGTRTYELFSGGEAFRINFAIRVALSQLLARRAGAHLRTLFLDEGFGTQDEEGRNRLIEAITTIQGDFDLILAITHIEELRDSFPVHIVVDKTPDGSRVSVR